MARKKIKIALFHCGFVYSGGGERIALEQARGLKKRGYRVEVFAPTIDQRLCFPDFLKELRVKTFLPSFTEKLPFRDAIRMVASSFLAPVLALNFKDVDLFFGANQPGAWLAFCMSKVLGKPYLVYLNQPNRLVYPRQIDRQTGWQNRKDYYLLAKLIGLFKPLVAFADKVSTVRAEALLVNGDYIGRQIKEIYQTSVTLCPGAAYPQPKSKLKLKQKEVFKGGFKIKKAIIKKPYVLITNRHEPQKMFEYVIEAMALVLKNYPQAALVIPGSFTDHTPKLKKLSKDLKIEQKTLFLGQISEKDLQKLYQHAAVYVYPSPDEDFGLGPLEAGVWAVPTVAWNHGGPTVTVVHQKTGYLAKPYEVNDYAKGILELLKNPQKRIKMGKAAWERAKKEFSWEKHVGIIDKEIKKISKT